MIFPIIFVAALAAAPAQPSPSRRADIVSAVALLDTPDRAVDGVGAVEKYGCAAVPYLVEGLHVVEYKHGYPERAPTAFKDDGVFWRIVALRAITRRDLTTKLKFYELQGYVDYEVEFLTQGLPYNDIRYFGYWPSRGNTFYAPPSVQARIIEKWRKFSESGACRAYDWKRHRGISKEYFLYFGIVQASTPYERENP